MPENTIASSAHRIQLDIARGYKREDARAEEKVQQEGSGSQSRDQGVEVSLSQQARSFGLSSSQVVVGTGELDKAKLSTPPVSSAAVDSSRRTEQDEPKTTETPASASLARQYNQSANEALGTLVDIRS